MKGYRILLIVTTFVFISCTTILMKPLQGAINHAKIKHAQKEYCYSSIKPTSPDELKIYWNDVLNIIDSDEKLYKGVLNELQSKTGVKTKMVPVPKLSYLISKETGWYNYTFYLAIKEDASGNMYPRHYIAFYLERLKGKGPGNSTGIVEDALEALLKGALLLFQDEISQDVFHTIFPSRGSYWEILYAGIKGKDVWERCYALAQDNPYFRDYIKKKHIIDTPIFIKILSKAIEEERIVVKAKKEKQIKIKKKKEAKQHYESYFNEMKSLLDEGGKYYGVKELFHTAFPGCEVVTSGKLAEHLENWYHVYIEKDIDDDGYLDIVILFLQGPPRKIEWLISRASYFFDANIYGFQGKIKNITFYFFVPSKDKIVCASLLGNEISPCISWALGSNFFKYYEICIINKVMVSDFPDSINKMLELLNSEKEE